MKSNLELDSSVNFPPLLGAPDQWLSDMAYARQRRIDELSAMVEEKEEIDRLRAQNQLLEEELDLVRMHPLYDEGSARINVNHQHWLEQKSELSRLSQIELYLRLSVFGNLVLLLTIFWLLL